MKKLSIVLILISLSQNLLCQHNEDLKYVSINILSNGIIGGIGSAFHHKSNESLPKAFVNGFWKGSLSGALQFSSRKILQQSALNDNLNLVWPSKLVDNVANTVLLNGTYNQKLFSTVYFQLYFMNLSYTFETKKIDWKLDVATIGYAVYLGFSSDQSFNFKNSLLTGSIQFDTYSIDTVYDGFATKLNPTLGVCIGNTITTQNINVYYYDKYLNNKKITTIKSIRNYKTKTIIHELIHSSQYNQTNSLNFLTINLLYKSIKIIYNKHLNININYPLLYLLNNINNYNNNLFEKEANYFSQSYFLQNTTFHY